MSERWKLMLPDVFAIDPRVIAICVAEEAAPGDAGLEIRHSVEAWLRLAIEDGRAMGLTVYHISTREWNSVALIVVSEAAAILAQHGVEVEIVKLDEE